MDTHRAEDPARSTEDQASMALHNRECHIEQDITLLIKGGHYTDAKRGQAGKKSAQKADITVAKEKGIGKDSERADGDRAEKRDRNKPDRKPTENKDMSRQSDTEQPESKRPRLDLTRMFSSRTRGRDDYNTIDVWENSQADAAPLKVDNWNEFPQTKDWAADTKIFTPSTQTAPGGSAPLTNATNVGGSGPPSSNHIAYSTRGAGSEILNKMGQGASQADGVTGGSSVQGGVTMSSVVAGLNNVWNCGVGTGVSAVVPRQSININMLLQKPQTNSNTSTGVSSNPGAKLLASLHQSSYTNSYQVGLSNQALPQRQKVQRPRGPQTSKIPASAVMPDNADATTDVQFGGFDFGSDSVMHVNKASGGSLLYGSASSKMDTFSAPSATYMDGVQLKTGSSVTYSSPFQNQRTFQVNQPASLNETNKASIPSNSSHSLDSHSISSLNQSQPKNQPSGPSSYGAAVNAGSATGSAFVSYGKGAPGFPAPGFPASAPPVVGAYNSSAAGAPGVPVAPSSYGSKQPTMPTQVGQQLPGYHTMNSMTGYGGQPAVPSGVQPNQPPMVSGAVSQTQLKQQTQNHAAFGNAAAAPQSNYHHSANSASTNSTGYAANSTGTSQYGSYGSKMANTMSGSTSVKDANDSSLNVASSTAGGAAMSTAQMTSGVHPGPVIAASTSTSSTKMATVLNSMADSTATSKMGGGIPPGMMMQPQGYILGQAGTVPAFNSVQAPVYGFDVSVQFVPRIPHQFPGYYDASGAGFGTGVPGAPGVSGRNDGAAIQAYSTATDGRFQRSDSSTASPVPSNLTGGNTQQAMYNAPVPGYYFLGNNAVVHGTPYPFAAAPPHRMYQAPFGGTYNSYAGARVAPSTFTSAPKRNVICQKCGNNFFPGRFHEHFEKCIGINMRNVRIMKNKERKKEKRQKKKEEKE